MAVSEHPGTFGGRSARPGRTRRVRLREARARRVRADRHRRLPLADAALGIRVVKILEGAARSLVNHGDRVELG
jgi:hypothetical protein